MANEILVKEGTPVVWADTADYSSTGSGFTRNYQITLDPLAAAAARQGAKGDLGATRPAAYAVRVGIEMGATPPAAGKLVKFYWSSSFSATAATGNDGGANGSDDSFTVAKLTQLRYIGALVLTANDAGTVQRATINPRFSPPHRYGMPVVYNGSAQQFDTDATQMYVALVPIVDEAQ